MGQENSSQQAAATPEAASLARIEQLLEQQAKHNKKMMGGARVRTVALVIILVMVVICAVLFFSMYSTLMISLNSLPDLIASVNKLATSTQSDLADIMASVKDINFNAINTTLEGVSKIDFGALNSSIVDLQKGVETFKGVVETISGGFKLFG